MKLDTYAKFYPNRLMRFKVMRDMPQLDSHRYTDTYTDKQTEAEIDRHKFQTIESELRTQSLFQLKYTLFSNYCPQNFIVFQL